MTGLQRASAAAAATRITEPQIDFLRELRRPRGAGRFDLPLATRAEDRTRQACRRAGWARYEKGRWVLTDVGRELISRY